MKYYRFSVLPFVLAMAMPALIYGQSKAVKASSRSAIFHNFMGYRNDNGEIQMEGEGYNILITAYKVPPDEDNFQKVAYNLHGPHRLLKKELNKNPLENYVLDASVTKTNPPLIAYDYLYGGKNNNIIDINIGRYGKVDNTFIDKIVSSIYYDGIYDSILIDTHTRSFEFVGHVLEFMDGCKWLRPHTLQCGKGCSATWSLYNTLAEAKEAKRQELALARFLGVGKMQDSATVPVMLEGVEAMANKCRFDKNFQDITLKNNMPTVAYYIAAEVRGRYIFCRFAWPEEEPRIPFLISRMMRMR